MRGSCLCGGITYEADRLDSAPRHCSCATCRKAHAAAFNTSASVARAAFRWTRGEEHLRAYESSPGKHRCFCGVCGTHLIAHRDGGDRIALRVATLDDDPHERPAAHIWTSSEVPWLAYGSGVRGFAGWESDGS